MRKKCKRARAAAVAAQNAARRSAALAEQARTAASAHEGAVRELAAAINARNYNGGERLRRSFQTLWVGGTLGAFFGAIAVTIPDTYRKAGYPVSYDATLDLTLRYGYMIWLLAYFFVSNLLNEDDCRADRWDVLFDVFQSAGALVAAWLLGFLSSDGFSPQPLAPALIGTNVVIALICAFSLYLFRKNSSGVNTYRWAGLVVTMLTLAAIGWPLQLQGSLVLTIAGISLGSLALLLVCYTIVRVKSFGRNGVDGGRSPQ